MSPFTFAKLRKTVAKKLQIVYHCKANGKHISLGVAQFGSAQDWGSWGRRFKSCHSDQAQGRVPCGRKERQANKLAFFLYSFWAARCVVLTQEDEMM